MRKLFATVLLLAICASASAGEWRGGFLVGQSKYDDNDINCGVFCTVIDTDDSDTAAGLNIGYGFNENWGLELGYIDFGEATIDAQFTSPVLSGATGQVSAEVGVSAIYLAATATYPFSDRWSVTGRLGAASVDFDVSANVQGVGSSADGTDEEVFFGASIDYDFGNAWSVGLRFDSVDSVDSVYALSLGANYRF